MRSPNSDYQQIILSVIGLTGIIALAVVAPNCLKLLRFLPKQESKKRNYINQVVGRLEKQGLVKIENNSKRQKVVRLTKSGKIKLKEYELEKLTINKPKRWDGKYRIIIFDIKEWKRSTRNKLRAWFQHLGLIRLQNSVWVYPYDCQEVVALLKANYHIGKEVLYMEVSYLENDSWLKKIFNLS